MADYVGVIKKHMRPYLSSLADDMKQRRSVDFFWPNGTQIYCGEQGSGKTISAVKHMLDLKLRYPKALIVSNLNLHYFRKRTFTTELELKSVMSDFNKREEYIFFSSMDELALALVGVNNGFYGVIYLIDEIHTYFNALDSMNIPMYVFTEISQQRKQRKVIIGTSQLFMRMAKPFREQCDNLIKCRTFFGILTFQKAYDGMTLNVNYDGSLSGNKKKSGFFFHNRYIRGAFDTYQKVVSGVEQYEQIQRLEITGKKGKPIKIG